MSARSIFLSTVFGLLAGVVSVHAHADEARVQECLVQASAIFKVDLVALQVLRELEGGQAGTASINSNGTYDYGPMQINSRWASQLARAGVSLETVRDDECVNAFVAAWIFRDALKTANGNTVMAMARYHSPTPFYQERYLNKALDVVRRHLANSESHSTSPMEQQQ